MTLGQHDQLVDAATARRRPPSARRRAPRRLPLRAKLETLRRDVTALAGAVDQARRKAIQAGVTLTR